MNKNYLADYEEFYYLTRDILEHPEFLKLQNIIHHGTKRYDHSMRVARVSYQVTKYLHLNYKETVRAALLHDFFLDDNQGLNKKERTKTIIMHPKYALEMSKRYFQLSPLEEDIIKTHMFPINLTVPKYLESWIVDIADDIVAVYEKCYGIRKQLSFASSFLFFLTTNYLK